MGRQTPLIAVVSGWGVEHACEVHGALTMDVDTRAEARLALTYADGIILTGGGDVDPQRYNQEPHKQVYGIDKERDNLEFWLVDAARKRGIPVMGICRGAQVINVAHGGTLDQNITDTDSVMDHWGVDAWVALLKDSRLTQHLGTAALIGSHYHHQAVRKVGRGLRAIAWAHDGTIEAIESAPGNKHYALGVQFHPEMDHNTDDNARAIFQHFVWNVCAVKANRRKQTAADRALAVDELTPSRCVEPTFGSYVSKSVHIGDDWEYESWLEERTQYNSTPSRTHAIDKYGMEDLEDIDAVCEAGHCVSPLDCMNWGDCAIDVVSNVTPSTVRFQSCELTNDERSDIEHHKRGNPRKVG